MLTKNMIETRILNTGLSQAHICKRIGVHRNFITNLIKYPGQISSSNKALKSLAVLIGVSYSDLVLYIENCKIQQNIEDYIPMYPNSITRKELCEKTGMDVNRLIAKLSLLENRLDVRIASLDDNDSVFSRTK